MSCFGAAGDHRSVSSAPRIQAAVSGNKGRIDVAIIVKGGVPSAKPSPTAPGHVIAMLAVRISGLPGAAIDAVARIAYVLRHHGACQHGKRDCGGTNSLNFVMRSSLVFAVEKII